jgi:hypothetical protein
MNAFAQKREARRQKDHLQNKYPHLPGSVIFKSPVYGNPQFPVGVILR